MQATSDAHNVSMPCLSIACNLQVLSKVMLISTRAYQEQKHVEASTAGPSSRPIFCFSAANHLTSKDVLPPDWASRTYDPLIAPAAHEPRPPPEGMQPGRAYFINLITHHAQWEKPFHRVLLEITRDEYQANMAASSLRGVLGFDACLYPPVLPVSASVVDGAPSKSSQARRMDAARKGAYMAQSCPRITWSGFKEVLAQVMTGLVRVDMEYYPENASIADQSGGEAPVRVANEESWQTLLGNLRAKSQEAAPEEQTEVDIDLLLFKSGDAGARLRHKS